MSEIKGPRLQRLDVAKINTGKTMGVFGKGASINLPNGQEVAIMARDVETLSEAFDLLVPNLNDTLDLKLVYDVVYLQSHHVTLADEEL
jgi:hypothetical protein